MTTETPTNQTEHLPLPMAFIKESLRICRDSPTGLRWVTYKPGRRKDLQAGSTSSRYAVVTLGKVSYRCHRIVWALANDKDPGCAVIDHKDGDPFNNHPDNLRDASTQENASNRVNINRNNTSGVKGVCWHKAAGKWWARVMRSRVTAASAFFTDLEEATAWVTAKRLELFGEFAPENRQGFIEVAREPVPEVAREPVQLALFG